MGNRKPNLSNLLAFLPPQEQQPLTMVNQINRSQTSSNASPQLDYGQQYDQSYYKLMQDRAEQVQALQKQMQELQSQKPNAFKEADLSTLLAYGDQLSGSRLAQNYKAPTAAQERKAMIEKLRGEVTKSQQGIADDQLAYLKMKAQEEKDRMSEQRMMAKLGKTQKTEMLPGQVAADREFGKEYVNWNQKGDRAGFVKNKEILDDAIRQLSSNPSLTGTLALKATPAALVAKINPASAAIEQKVKSTVVSMVKQLGANPTDTDLKEIQKSVWDKDLPTSANIDKLNLFLNEQMQKAKAKDEASRYFEQTSGTLSGENRLAKTQRKVAVVNSKTGETMNLIDPTDQDLQEAASEGFVVQ
jgi:hypothetical protein